MENERYRASIESGHQMLQAQIGERTEAAQASSQQPSYQFKFMKSAESQAKLAEANLAAIE